MDDATATALVTGGGTGIGRAIAVALVGLGWDVAVTGRRPGPLDDVVGALGADHCLAVPGDIADPSAATGMVDATIGRFGRLDLLVNNAALAHTGRLADVALDQLHEMVSVNLTGTLLMSQAAIAPLREQRGQIINIGSVGGLVASRVSSVYGATKAAVHHLTTCLARELAPDTRVNTVVPGPTQTDILDESSLARLSASTLLGRVGQGDEIARWVVMLADPASAWVTGAMITVDGGYVVGV